MRTQPWKTICIWQTRGCRVTRSTGPKEVFKSHQQTQNRSGAEGGWGLGERLATKGLGGIRSNSSRWSGDCVTVFAETHRIVRTRGESLRMQSNLTQKREGGWGECGLAQEPGNVPLAGQRSCAPAPPSGPEFPKGPQIRRTTASDDTCLQCQRKPTKSLQ